MKATKRLSLVSYEDFMIGSTVFTGVKVQWVINIDTGEAFGIDEETNEWYAWYNGHDLINKSMQ